jgi:hypothetical protein
MMAARAMTERRYKTSRRLRDGRARAGEAMVVFILEGLL